MAWKLLKRNPTNKIKANIFKQFKTLKDYEFIDNKLLYLKPGNWSTLRFYGQPKMRQPGVPIRPIVSWSDSPLYNLYTNT